MGTDLDALQAAEPNKHEPPPSDSTSMASRTIRATHTADIVRVYQAYSNAIADAVLEGGSFRHALDRGLWSASRMTWIKPSKVWMAYRCGWTVLKDAGQARVLAIDLARAKFEELLERGMLSDAGGDGDGGKKCRNSSVVIQWDPERRISPSENGRQAHTRGMPRTRSIQIGLRPPANEFLLDPAVVVGIADVTDDFRNAVRSLRRGEGVDEAVALLWPDGRGETVLRLPRCIEVKIGMTPRPAPGIGADSGDAVVVLGCAANPPHQGHFYCLEAAKSQAEQLGYNVLWTTIAAAPFGYVQNKMKRAGSASATASSADDAPGDRIALSDETRMRVLRTMASWTMARNPSLMFSMPERTYGSALECGRSLRPSPDTKVIVVVGGDMFDWTKRSRPDVITVGCARDEAQFAKLRTGLGEAVRGGLLANPDRWILTSGVGPRTSSTLIRGILANTEWSMSEKVERLRREGYPVHAANTLIHGAIVQPDILVDGDEAVR